MAKKTSLKNVVATSSFTVVRKVTLQSLEERQYQSKNEATGKVSDDYRYFVILEDKRGDNNIFGNQLVFCLNPEEDTAVPALRNAPVGTEGEAVFKIRYFVVKNEIITERNGEESIIPFTHETEVNLIDFLPAEDDAEDDDEYDDEDDDEDDDEGEQDEITYRFCF